MTALAGTGALVRLALRRDRIMIPAWIFLLAGMAAYSAKATIDLYPTLASRVEAGVSVNRAQSLVALYGRVYDPTSLGAVSMIKMGGIGSVFVAIFILQVVIRHTRAEEEAGRLELIGAAVVGRLAPLTAALLVAAGASITLSVCTAAGLVVAGLPLVGSIAFGLAWGGIGLAFASIAGIFAQLTTGARAATGLTSTALGLMYVLRAVGDTASVSGPRWLTWLSPFGWSQQFRPYAGDRWWVLLITMVFSISAGVCAYVLVARRDLGAGLLPDRPGRAAGPRLLRSPLALAWRLHRGTLLAWTSAYVLLGLFVGNLLSNLGGFLNNQQARNFITELGGKQGLADAFLAMYLGIVGVITSAYGVQAALRLRSEELQSHAESVLATPTSRMRWAGSHVVLAMVGTSLLMLVVGMSIGVAHAARTGREAEIGRVLGAALVQLPAVWVLVGIVVAIFGVVPRYVAAGWGVLVAFLLLGELGPLFSLDQRVMDISPFAHTPRMPGAPLAWTPLIVLTVVAAALIVGGLAGFQRRDLE